MLVSELNFIIKKVVKNIPADSYLVDEMVKIIRCTKLMQC